MFVTYILQKATFKINIYIFVASVIWRFTYICYKAKAQQWKESKIETKKEQHKNT